MPTLKSSQQIRTLIYARFVFIVLQIVAITVAQHLLDHDLPYHLLYGIVIFEVMLNLAYLLIYQPSKQVTNKDYLLQLVVDTVILTCILFVSGGASNPFVSLLLIPIALASVALPKLQLLIVTLVSVTAYSFLLLTLSPHDLHHMNMEQHFTGMWINFILSTLVIVVGIASLISAMNRQEKLISAQREEQLRQEQLLSLGAAAAQFAHRLATPLATANLLAEELHELHAVNINQQSSVQNREHGELSKQLELQLLNCSRHLDDFRLMAEQVKNNVTEETEVQALLANLQQEVQLSFPQAQVHWQLSPQITQKTRILTEPILVPALLNLIQNAINASNTNNSQRVEVSTLLHAQHLSLQIKDNGKGFADDTLLQLGSELVDSENGLGMGVFLSHVTLEKLGGTLKLYNQTTRGAVAEVTLPLTNGLIDGNQAPNAQVQIQ